MPKDHQNTLELPGRVLRCEGQVVRAEAPGEGEEDERAIELSFSSEEPYERFFGIEILGHERGEVDLEWIGSGRAPLLVDHRAGVDHQVGVIERAWIEGGVGRARVRFGKGARASEVLARVRDGELSAVSVGYRVREMKLTEASQDGPDTYRVTDWRPLEVSLVSIPADSTVGVGRDGDEGGTVNVTITREEGTTMPRENENAAAGGNDGAGTSQRQAQQQPPVNALSDEERQRLIEETRKAEAERVAEIESVGARFNVPQDQRAKAIRNGMSVAEFRGLVLDQLGERAQEELTNSAMIGMTEAETQRFSIMRLVRHMLDPTDAKLREAARFELEVCRTAEEQTEHTVRGMMVPVDVLRRPDFVAGQRELSVGTATAGGNLVATDLLAGSFIDLLRNRSLFFRLGATRLMDLVGDVAIPRQSGGATAAWIAEGADAGESDPTFDQVPLTPRTLAAYTDIGRRLAKQSSVDVEGLVRRDLATAVALGIDLAGLYGAGGNAPTGVANQTGINTTTFGAANPTWAEVVAMESAVATDNADEGALAYAIEPTMRGTFKTTEKASGTARFLWEDGGTVNGYTTGVSNQITAGDVFFGNWADAVVGMWGGLDLMVDPYSRSLSGATRLVVHQDVDVAVRHPVSFCHSNDGV